MVAERLAKRYGWRVDPEAVVLVPGVNAGVNLAVRALTRPRRRPARADAGVPRPSLRAAGNHGVSRYEAPPRAGTDGRYAVDMDAFGAAPSGSNPRLHALQPAQPGGPALRAPRAGGDGERVPAARPRIIADEIHSDLVLDGRPHVPMATLAPEVEERTITLLSP